MLQIHVDSATSHQQQTGAWRGIEADQASDSGSDMDSGDDDAGSSGSAGGPLFSAAFGDIGLAGSIFGLLGTPNFETWPVRFFTMSVIILENPVSRAGPGGSQAVEVLTPHSLFSICQTLTRSPSIPAQPPSLPTGFPASPYYPKAIDSISSV